MDRSSRPLICERVRNQISVSLDAEASELDRRLVAAHLARCAECRAFEAPVRAVTEELRAAPLESLGQPVFLARPRTRRRARLVTAEYSAAAMMVIALLGVASQVGRSDSQGRGTLATSNLFGATWQPEQELAQIKPAGAVRPLHRPDPFPAI